MLYECVSECGQYSPFIIGFKYWCGLVYPLRTQYHLYGGVLLPSGGVSPAVGGLHLRLHNDVLWRLILQWPWVKSFSWSFECMSGVSDSLGILLGLKLALEHIDRKLRLPRQLFRFVVEVAVILLFVYSQSAEFSRIGVLLSLLSLVSPAFSNLSTRLYLLTRAFVWIVRFLLCANWILYISLKLIKILLLTVKHASAHPFTFAGHIDYGTQMMYSTCRMCSVTDSQILYSPKFTMRLFFWVPESLLTDAVKRNCYLSPVSLPCGHLLGGWPPRSRRREVCGENKIDLSEIQSIVVSFWIKLSARAQWWS